MQCPKCQFEQVDTARECLRCGLIFSKVRGASAGGVGAARPPRAAAVPRSMPPADAGARPAAPASAPDELLPPLGEEPDAAASDLAPWQRMRLLAQAESAEPFAPEPLSVEKEGWVAVGIGLGLALVLPFFSLLNFLLHPIQTLLHEFGHALFGWIFGYPSIPKFDFQYGGGLTVTSEERYLLLVLVVVVFLGSMIYHARGNKVGLVFFSGLLVLYGFLAFSMDYLIALYMGHGTVLIFASLFLYRGISNWGVIHPVERPLYAFLGFWITFREMSFAYDLMTNPYAREVYREGKGGVLPHDFTQISDWLGIGLTSVARFHMFNGLVALGAAFLIYRYKNYLVGLARRVLGVEAH